MSDADTIPLPRLTVAALTAAAEAKRVREEFVGVKP